MILELREKHTRWGARKIRAMLERGAGAGRIPGTGNQHHRSDSETVRVDGGAKEAAASGAIATAVGASREGECVVVH